MKKINKTQIIKIFKILLILIWMIRVFSFSNEDGEKSSSTSRKVTTAVVQTVSNKSEEENKSIIDRLDRVVRKLAHYTIYTVGGILIINYFYEENKNQRKQVMASIVFGAVYAATDEIHQFFVSDRSASIFDVGIDTLGVVTGILIYMIIRRVINKVKNLK